MFDPDRISPAVAAVLVMAPGSASTELMALSMVGEAVKVETASSTLEASDAASCRLSRLRLTRSARLPRSEVEMDRSSVLIWKISRL